VTVSGKPDEALLAHAQGRAIEWGLPFFPRGRKEPIGPMLGAVADALLVFGRLGLTLRDRQGQLAFGPALGVPRVRQMDAGVEEDSLMRHAQLRPSESVLDCTFGLGADALVAARAVGTQGRVVGLEKSLPLFALAQEGLRSFEVGPRSCPIEVRHEDAAELMKHLSDASFDCVLFDPMFGRAKRSSPQFEMLRRYADHSPLTQQMLVDAQRVARRCVVVKGARYSDDLKKLGLKSEPASRQAPVLWARLPGIGLSA
jgi:16S rRNA (guanine1516-N2)-methyltransferase